MKHYRCMTAYHVAYAPFLIRLGLYQIAVMPHKKIDAALIHGLVERWRPETHTFHLPFGEMTGINFETTSNKFVLCYNLMTIQMKKFIFFYFINYSYFGGRELFVGFAHYGSPSDGEYRREECKRQAL